MTNQLHADAIKRFESLPYPTTSDEHWRFANLKFWGNEIKKFVETYRTDDCELSSLEDDLSRRFYRTLLSGGKFDALVAAAFCSRRLTVIPAGEKLKLQDTIEGLANVFVIGEGAELEILRTYNFESENFWTEANCFYIGKNAKLKVNTHFTSGENSPRYSRNDFYLSDGAELVDVFVENGKTHTRAERNFHLEGASAKADAFALLDCQDGITHDFRSSQIHSSGGAHSNVKVKNILSDTACSAFMGFIRVEEGSQKTEAYQSCRSLLLSPRARASASPILEIMANDVMCSHGCAVARPDKEQIFYMKSRGLSDKNANRLLVGGFANEILDKFSDSVFAERVRLCIEK